MKQKIENLLYLMLEDFNTKWKSHEEKNDGINNYANKILALQQSTIDNHIYLDCRGREVKLEELMKERKKQ